LCKAGGGVVGNGRCEVTARTRCRDIAGHLGFESAAKGLQIRWIGLLHDSREKTSRRSRRDEAGQGRDGHEDKAREIHGDWVLFSEV